MKRKLNVVDYGIIVLVILVLAGGGLFIAKKLNKDSSASSIVTGKQKVIMVCDAHTVLPEVAKMMKAGDKLVAQKSFQDAEVLEVTIDKDFEIGALDGNIVKIDKPEFKYVTVKISGMANRYGPYLDMGGQMLKAGEPYWIKTDKANLFGSILSVELVEE